MLPIVGKPPGVPRKPEDPVRVHRFYANTAPVFIEAAPEIINANYVIEADVEIR